MAENKAFLAISAVRWAGDEAGRRPSWPR